MENAFDALRATVAACQAAHADYAVIGGVARNAWAPPRATTDLDLAVFVTVTVYEHLIRKLASAGFQPEKSIFANPQDALTRSIFRCYENGRRRGESKSVSTSS